MQETERKFAGFRQVRKGLEGRTNLTNQEYL